MNKKYFVYAAPTAHIWQPKQMHVHYKYPSQLLSAHWPSCTANRNRRKLPAVKAWLGNASGLIYHVVEMRGPAAN
jgi:hypothetical protein